MVGEHSEACDNDYSEVVRNCFKVQTKNQGKVYLLFRDEHALVLDKDHKCISMTNYQLEIDERLTQCYICREDFKQDGNSFLLTFQVMSNDLSANMCKNIYEGSSLSNTWIVRCKLNLNDLKLEDVDK